MATVTLQPNLQPNLRPNHPQDGLGRRAVSGLGRTLITMGVLLLLFVAYQLWGTGIATARSQDGLQADLEAVGLNFGAVPDDLLTGDGSAVVTIPLVTVAEQTTLPAEPTAPTESSVPTPSTVLATPAAPPTTRFGKELVSRSKTRQQKIAPGEAIGRIVIKRIGVDNVIVSGADKESLKKGPGHYAKTPLPGESGNSAIACHRTTFGAPCFRVAELKIGDPIFIASKTSGRWFRYNVTEQFVVKPSQNEVLLPKGDRNTLTLTTCDPQYSAKQRRIIVADLVGESVESDVEFVEGDPLADQLKEQQNAKAGITVAVPATIAPVRVAPTSTGPTSTGPTSVASQIPVDSVSVQNSGQTVDETPTIESPTVDTPTLDGTTTDRAKRYGFSFLKGSAAAWTQSLAWAAVCGFIWLAAWLLAHKRRQMLLRWAIYGSGFVVAFLPALYFCFINISGLLPEAV